MKSCSQWRRAQTNHFLLELLTDCQYVNIIQWVGNNGKFKVIDQDEILRLWGERKNMLSKSFACSMKYYKEEGAKIPMMTKFGCEKHENKFIILIKDAFDKDPQQIRNHQWNGKGRQPRLRYHSDFIFTEECWKILDNFEFLKSYWFDHFVGQLKCNIKHFLSSTRFKAKQKYFFVFHI